MIKTRPNLRYGDLVKLHKKYHSNPLYELSAETVALRDTFVVLRINGRSSKHEKTSNNGLSRVEVLNLRTKEKHQFDRKQLWKTGANWKDYYSSFGIKTQIF